MHTQRPLNLENDTRKKAHKTRNEVQKREEEEKKQYATNKSLIN